MANTNKWQSLKDTNDTIVWLEMASKLLPNVYCSVVARRSKVTDAAAGLMSAAKFVGAGAATVGAGGSVILSNMLLKVETLNF
uniref:Uncharacterized protein n=1 Tax=Amphimedon queenslandica TaxID=400682 RepID=A0A1X7T2R6_AMPQE